MTNSFDWHAAYDALHATYPMASERPIVAITGNFVEGETRLLSFYTDSVLAGGALPLIVPPTFSVDHLPALLHRVDALLLSGGADINPLLMGEEPQPGLQGINARRDVFELVLTRLAFDRQIPILGICRGIQTLAMALEGAVWQDINAGHPAGERIKHTQQAERFVPTHSVHIEPGSLLHRIMGSEVLAVNSFHHQAVREPGPHLRIVATAPDGIVEAVESNEGKSILGVQWHPECFLAAGDESMSPIFKWLAHEAASYRRARRLHSRILTLDTHCDTPMFFDRDIHFDRRDPQILVDLHKMQEGGLDSTIMVAYLEQGERTPEALQAATKKADHILTRIEQMVRACSRGVGLARTPGDLWTLKREHRHAIMLGIENGYAIGRDLSLVEHFRRRGVVYMTLCHNGDNDICDSAQRSKAEHGGLSEFGRRVVAEMNRTGMMVDLSHAAESSFYDALKASRLPIVCSHSSARALCNHPRNLTDDQLRALAQSGGVAQVTFYGGFLRTDGSSATIDDALAHLLHMIAVAGIDHVGIGSDFDGDGGVRGLASAAEMINFTRRLQSEGFDDDDMQKIWGGNFLRVMRQVQVAGIEVQPSPSLQNDSTTL